MQVNLGDARDKLSQLVQAVLDGEEVTICRNGEPAVDLIVARGGKSTPRRFGTMKGRIVIHDPDWHRGPQTDEELAAWIDGKFE